MRAVWWPVLSSPPSGARPHRGLLRVAPPEPVPRRIRTWARSAVVAACFALSGLGCDARSDADATLYALELDRIEGQLDLTGHFIRDELDQAVRGSTMFAHGETQRAPKALSARLRMAVLQIGEDAEVLRVELLVEDPPEPLRAFGRDFEAVVELERVDSSIDLEQDVPEALRRAVAVLDTKAVLVRGDPAAIQRILLHPDPELVVLAVEWIGRHRLRAHADQIAALIEHADDRVVLRAVECLAVVGTQEHARALVTRPRLADRAHASRLYDTLAGLGGPDAVGFLEFAVRNEDDPALAELARRALERARHDGDADSEGRAWLRRGHR